MLCIGGIFKSLECALFCSASVSLLPRSNVYVEIKPKHFLEVCTGTAQGHTTCAQNDIWLFTLLGLRTS